MTGFNAFKSNLLFAYHASPRAHPTSGGYMAQRFEKATPLTRQNRLMRRIFSQKHQNSPDLSAHQRPISAKGIPAVQSFEYYDAFQWDKLPELAR
jgi:hypothetical protein